MRIYQPCRQCTRLPVRDGVPLEGKVKREREEDRGVERVTEVRAESLAEKGKGSDLTKQ